MNIVEKTVADAGIETYWVRHVPDQNVSIYVCQTGKNLLVTWDVLLGSERHSFPVRFLKYYYGSPSQSVVIEGHRELDEVICHVINEAYKGFPNSRNLKTNDALPFLGFTKVIMDHGI